MKEHYGIDIPSSTVRLITEKHAHKFASLEKIAGVKEEILRKEVKLSFARGHDKVHRFYAGGIGTAEEASQRMLECAILAGMKDGTYIHALGDGAPWIAEQVKLKFCNRGGYLNRLFSFMRILIRSSYMVRCF